jgi:hypothetical protein
LFDLGAVRNVGGQVTVVVLDGAVEVVGIGVGAGDVEEYVDVGKDAVGGFELRDGFEEAPLGDELESRTEMTTGLGTFVGVRGLWKCEGCSKAQSREQDARAHGSKR